MERTRIWQVKRREKLVLSPSRLGRPLLRLVPSEVLALLGKRGLCG